MQSIEMFFIVILAVGSGFDMFFSVFKLDMIMSHLNL